VVLCQIQMDYKFLIPTIISFAAIVWNFFQQKEMVRLQRVLDRRNLVHKIQFEKEFFIYSELWSKLIALRNITSTLRPRIEAVAPGKSKEDLKKEKLEKIVVAFNEAVIMFDNNRPFYSPEVYKEINELLKVSRDEMIEFQYLGYTDMSDYKKAEENVNKIITSMDNICEIIRKRIDYIEVL